MAGATAEAMAGAMAGANICDAIGSSGAHLAALHTYAVELLSSEVSSEA